MKRAIYRDGFFKVSRRLLDSSLWCEDADVVKVFLTLIALSQDPHGPRNGTVFIARKQLAGRCFVTEERLADCIAILAKEDPQSRTTSSDGRRLEILPNGFRVLNYSLYHDRDADEELSRSRARAGRVGGTRSGEVRSVQQDDSKQNRSKPEAKRSYREEIETETERENVIPAAPVQTAFHGEKPGNGKPRSKRETWLTPYEQAWKERFGAEAEAPLGQIMAAFSKPGPKSLGHDELLARWKRWLAAAKTSKDAKPLWMVEDLGRWAVKAPETPQKPRWDTPEAREREAKHFAAIEARKAGQA